MPSTADSGSPPLAAVVLAAGAGTRLRPLTRLRPKPLCPVGDRPLLDWALERLGGLAEDLDVVVNAHHGAPALVNHLRRRCAGTIGEDGSVVEAVAPVRGRARLAGRGGSMPLRPVLVSHEEGEALGTAGALGRLRPWLDGRGALVVNADAWTDVEVAPLLEGWDGARPRVLVAGSPAMTPDARVAGALVPWSVVAGLTARPAGLWEVCWRPALADGSLDVVGGAGRFVDCGTPADYLAANLAALGPGRRTWLGPGAVVPGRADASVVGAGALVEGEVLESVVWPGAHVAAGERLVRAVRAPSPEGQLTVLVR